MPTPEWSTDNLRVLMQHQIDDLQRLMTQQVNDLRTMLDERYETQTRALDAAFIAQSTAMQTALTAAKQAVETALQAQEKAVDKAEAAAEKRFDSFRLESDMRIRTVADKLDDAESRNMVRFSELTSRLDMNTGQDFGVAGNRNNRRLDMTLGLAVLSFLVSAASVIFLIIRG